MILISKKKKVKGILKLIWFLNFGESDFESEWILRDFVLLDDNVKNFRNFGMRNFDEDDEISCLLLFIFTYDLFFLKIINNFYFYNLNFKSFLWFKTRVLVKRKAN